MSNITCYDVDGNILDHYTQWDSKQKLIVRGADESSAPQFHFSNSFSKKSLVASSTITTSGIVTDVPDILLQSALPITVYMYYSNNDAGNSKYSIRIPVLPKKEPENYIYSNGQGGISLDNAKVIIDDRAPKEKSVLWFDTSAVN